jgi:hypothetical protein
VHLAKSSTWSMCLALAFGLAHAEETWLTLAGDPQEPKGDYIQLDPAALTRENDLRTLPLRVSGGYTRTSQDGIAYRSLTGIAAIDCQKRTARIVRASYYAEPEFKGAPFKTSDAGAQINPVTLRGLDADRTKQLIHAACDAVIRSD